jgi:hypothetical protein
VSTLRHIALLTMLIGWLCPRPSEAITCTWKSSGGTGGAFSTAGNWALTGTGGSTACPPAVNDTAVFNAGSLPCTLTANVSVSTLTTSSPFAGTISPAAQSITTAGSLNFGAGTLASGTSDIIVGADLNLSGGTFTSTSGKLQVSGAFNETGGTFAHNSGRVLLTAATGTQTFASAGATFNNLFINDGLVGYWKLDEGTGTAATDSSGYGNSGTLVSGPSWLLGAASLPSMSFTDPAGLSFDGVDDHVDFTYSGMPAANAAQTISLWVKATAAATTQNFFGLFGPSSGVQLGIRQVSSVWSLVAWKNGGTVLASSPAAAYLGAWHHIVYTFDGTTHKLYIDGGTPVTSTVSPQTAAVNQVTMGSSGGSFETFAGSLDEVRVYTRVLTPAEVYALYLTGQPSTSAATQTLTGSPVVLGDLVIASGKLAIGTNNLTVGGNWWNYGGAFTTGASGGVTFNGSGASNKILAAGSVFRDLTISGVGSWTVSDTGTMTLGGSFGQSAGTFVSTAGLLDVQGAFNKTGGTFTHNSGRVVLSASSNQTFATNSATFNHLAVTDALSPVGYWKLDETSLGTAVDSSGYHDDGTHTNGPTLSSSVPSVAFSDPRSVSFNGTSQCVALGNSATMNLSGPITMSTWINNTSTSGFNNILSHGYITTAAVTAEVYLRINGGVYQCGSYNGTDFSTAYAVPAGDLNTWVHLACTYDGSAWRLFRNGTQVSSTTATTGAIPVPEDWAIGSSKNCTDRFFHGSIDEVRLYDRALSAAEIAILGAGNQPAVSTTTQTLSGSIIVLGDLAIAGGILSTATNALTVGGSWLNTGGLVTSGGSGTVTFNGSGSNTIRSNRQIFENIVINGTGTWTLADRLETSPSRSVTTTAGTLDLSSQTLRTGDINRNGAVTITPSSGTVVLDGDASRTLDTGTFNNLRVEPVKATGLVGYWKLDEGVGTILRDYSGSGNTGALVNGSLWTTSSLPGITFEDPAALVLDGVNDYASLGATNMPALGASMTVSLWMYYASVPPASQDVFVLKGAGDLLEIGFLNGAGPKAYRTAGNVLVTPSSPPTSGWHHVAYTFDGTTHSFYIDGGTPATSTATAPTGAVTSAWIGTYDGLNQLFNGKVDDVRVYNVVLTAAQIKALATGTYPAGLAGTPTYTLGNATTVGGTFAQDSGTFATSSYTLNVSSTGSAATVNSGTYTAGSTTSTFAGGLTIGKYGSLGMATSGGTVSVGSAKVLTIDGTLNASSTGATIQSSSGFYTFKVGSTSTATPVLSISGLSVKNTDTNGMYVNAVAGSTTTLTQFDNIAFSSGTGARLLQIYAPTLLLESNGCSFDAGASVGTTTKNVTLRGDGNSGTSTETRALFGNATCLNGPTYSLCETYDDDDDSGADGVGDTAASNAAVIQWVHSAQSDTSGTIEGFPTAAFDWNTFTYYSTYVLYHDVAGGTADRIYVRNTNGNALYSWDGPSGADFIGTPRFDTVSSVHYVYVATTTGKVYRLIDNGTSALTPDNTGSWAGANNPYDCACTIATPLTIDSNNIYWGGVIAAANKIWTLGKSSRTLASSSPMTSGLTVAISAAAPALWIDSAAHTQIFMGSAAHFYKVDINAQSLTTDNNLPTGTVNGRITILSSKVYGADSTGKLLVLDAANFGNAALWSYHDNTNHSGCTSGVCAITGALYVDPILSRVYYGDSDGHLYASYNSSGTVGAQITAGYPIRPGSASDIFGSAPLYNSGVLVAGTTTGSVYLIDVNGGSGPVLKQTYQFGPTTKISGIGFDKGSQSYMVSTADPSAKDGKLIYIDLLADPTPGSN